MSKAKLTCQVTFRIISSWLTFIVFLVHPSKANLAQSHPHVPQSMLFRFIYEEDLAIAWFTVRSLLLPWDDGTSWVLDRHLFRDPGYHRIKSISKTTINKCLASPIKSQNKLDQNPSKPNSDLYQKIQKLYYLRWIWWKFHLSFGWSHASLVACKLDSVFVTMKYATQTAFDMSVSPVLRTMKTFWVLWATTKKQLFISKNTKRKSTKGLGRLSCFFNPMNDSEAFVEPMNMFFSTYDFF